jgi:hypothetical protein
VVLELDASAAGTRLVGLVERLLGEPAAFLTPTQLSSLMTEVGIEGSSDRARGPSYWFVGRTESTGDVGARLSGA